MIAGHIGGVPVEELAPFAPAAGTALVALVGSRRAAARAQRAPGRRRVPLRWIASAKVPKAGFFE